MGWLADKVQGLMGKTKADYAQEYDNAFKDTRQAQAEAAADFYDARDFYNANKDAFSAAGVSDPFQTQWDANGKATSNFLQQQNAYGDALNTISKEKADMMEKQKYNWAGDGVLPSMFALNAWPQVFDAANDLGKGLQNVGANVIRGANIDDPFADWNSRDHLSDIGAAGQAALSVALPVSIGLSSAGLAAGGAGAAANSLGKAVLAGAGSGAAYGGAGSLADYLRDNGKDSSIGGAIGSTAIGATMGGLLGGASSAAGYGLNKLGQSAVKNRMGDYIATGTLDDRGKAVYQTALNDVLQNPSNYSDELVAAVNADKQKIMNAAAGGAKSSGKGVAIANSANTGQWRNVNPMDYISADTKTMLMDEILSRAGANGYDPIDVYNLMGANFIDTTSPAAQSLYSQYGVAKSGTGRTLQGLSDYLTAKPTSKVGQTLGKVASTKLGKAALAGGTAFTVAGLLGRSRGNDSNELTDEEMEMLYNYYLNGGY